MTDLVRLITWTWSNLQILLSLPALQQNFTTNAFQLRWFKHLLVPKKFSNITKLQFLNCVIDSDILDTFLEHFYYLLFFICTVSHDEMTNHSNGGHYTANFRDFTTHSLSVQHFEFSTHSLPFIAVRAKKAEDSPTLLLEKLLFELTPTSFLRANRRPFSLMLHFGSERIHSTSWHYNLRQTREFSGLRLPYVSEAVPRGKCPGIRNVFEQYYVVTPLQQPSLSVKVSNHNVEVRSMLVHCHPSAFSQIGIRHVGYTSSKRKLEALIGDL